jgi:molecular chaperone DnaK (HSP70)
VATQFASKRCSLATFFSEKLVTMQNSSAIDSKPSRYVVGIDLGTTNSAVCYVDTWQTPWRVELLSIPQLVAAGQVETRDTLPSFHFEPVPGSLEPGSLQLPWFEEASGFAVGILAREEGVRSPERLIVSAKSWLCHTGVDRTADLLPWQGAAQLQRLSPATASSRYLAHLRKAWEHRFPDAPLAEQEIILTLPASFDEVARELTVAAAAEAELPRVVLIEEPQAAFYSWVDEHAEDWHRQVRAGQTILVCDIGGGTSDFTLIQARPVETSDSEASPEGNPSEGTIRFHRVAVGNHLILGGDNLDLALAHHLESRLQEDQKEGQGTGKLTTRQWDVLVRSCRRVKETLLGRNAPEQVTVHLPGAGARLVGGGLQVVVSRGEVESLLVEGFLPPVALGERPTSGGAGFRQFGLPYAEDPAITRHLAAFLSAHREVVARDGSGPPLGPVPTNRAQTSPSPHAARPDVVLFNGGFFASPLLQDRLLSVLSGWFSEEDQPWSPQVLENKRLDLAVARGAAYYGMVRRGEGVRIAANLARSYYIGVAGSRADHHADGARAESAVCLVPGDAQPGQQIDLEDRQFDLTVSQPVEFALYVSSTRLTDAPGEIVPVDREQMAPLPPIRTVLHADRRRVQAVVPVTLHASLSEIGTIEMWCQARGNGRRWRLQFDIRSTTQTDISPHEGAAEQEGYLDETTWQACEQILATVFATGGTEKPSTLMKRLAAGLDRQRADWPSSFLRRIWEQLMQLEAGRRRSAAHEARWLNLLGYALRPGYGLAVDDWRVAETWRAVRGKLNFPASDAESLVLWRRIAGGLTAGQQVALAEPLVSSVRAAHASSTTGKRGNPSLPMHQSSEAWRLLGSLELLDIPVKVQLGKWLCDLLPKRKYEKVRRPMIWALGRLGQRVPLHGPLNTVVPVEAAAAWIESLLPWDEAGCPLAVMQLARRTEDRHRDIGVTLRDEVVRWLSASGAAEHLVKLVRDGGRLASDEQDRVFGEALPKGLSLGSSE